MTQLSKQLLRTHNQLRMGAISVTDYGAVGDGVTDDRTAIQAALDAANIAGGGIVFVPPVDVAAGKYYRIAKEPLLMRDNVTLKGAGYASLIRNDNTSGIVINEYCVLFGFAHPDHTDDTYTKYTIADTSAGDDTITFDIPTDAGNFTVGGLIVVMNGLNYTLNAQPIYHDYLLTRVTSVNSGTGVIELEHACDVAYVTSGAVSPQVFDLNESGITFDHGFAAFGTQRAGLCNLALKSDNGRAIARGGTLESTIKNVWIDSNALLAVNLFAHCEIQNIWAQTNGRGVELKEGSHDNNVRGIHINFHSGGSPSSAFDFGESARNNHVRDWFIDYADQNSSGTPINFGSAKHNTVTHGKLITHAETGVLVGFIKSAADSPDDMACEYNEFSHNRVLGSVGAFWELQSHDATACRRNRIQFNDFLGSVTTEAGLIEGSENYVLFNYHEDGRINWAGNGGGGAAKNYVFGNVTPDGPNPDSGGLHDDLAKNYACHNIEGTNFDPDDSRRSVLPVTSDFTLTAQSDGLGFTNEGAIGTVVITLPAARPGKRFRLYRQATQTFRFDPNGTEKIRKNDGTLGGAGKYISLDADASFVELWCYNEGEWFATIEVGTVSLEA